jgi:hypothetical protein
LMTSHVSSALWTLKESMKRAMKKRKRQKWIEEGNEGELEVKGVI